MNIKKYGLFSLIALACLTTICWLLYSYFYGGNSTSSLIFITPGYLYSLWVIPVIYTGFYFQQTQKNRLWKQAGSPLFGKKISVFRVVLNQFLLAFSLTFLLIALAQPIYGKKKVKGVSRSMEIAICLDISNSMNVKDIEGESRLEVSKRTIKGLIQQLSGEKIGLCLFAGDALIQMPLTSDYGTTDLFTSEVQTSFISNQGTNVVEALETGVLMFTKSQEPKCIIMITDGEDHQDHESEVFNYIREEQISFYGIGIGTSTGGSIPEDPFDEHSSVKRDNLGFTVISKLNAGYIKSLSQKLNGTAIITSEAYPDLNAILTEINHAKSTKSRNLDFEIKASIYEYAVLLSLIAMVLWIVLKGVKAYE